MLRFCSGTDIVRQLIRISLFIPCQMFLIHLFSQDYAPVETDLVNDKLINAQVNNERAITEEIEQKRNAGIPAINASYPREKKKNEIESYIDQLDENDEKGFFLNLLG